ncbi:uncharacterized protein H6S33_002222 [Morchella sextelata]|uniref:uncharacterized protein n=1 Tax=Morchella sextelata TaxID=1174677 RepID=UPI001D05436E|nr:uncharacterized protein H6S33_002222 [Morchella sextelata]KAH0608170.1 hypothetical protein H6S33_002222 [Morchella sextelata]
MWVWICRRVLSTSGVNIQEASRPRKPLQRSFIQVWVIKGRDKGLLTASRVRDYKKISPRPSYRGAFLGPDWPVYIFGLIADIFEKMLIKLVFLIYVECWRRCD